jgi:hypothetical protein
MSTVKITDLPAITTIGSNTANSILVGVDIPTNITGKITLTTLARSLYSNNNLYVGNTLIILPNAVAQFTSNSDNYVQINLQNERPNGSGDLVVTADTGTDEDYFIDMGFNNSTYNFPGYTFARPLDGYLVVQGNNTSPTAIGGNLVIGTTTVGKDIIFTQGTIGQTGQVGRFIYNTGFKLVAKPLIFADNTTQNTAIDYPTINSRISSNTTTLRSEISSNVSALNSSITSNIATANLFTQAAFNKANNALANTTGTFSGSLTVTGNVSSNYAMSIHNPTMPGNGIFLLITGSAGNAFGVPSNPGYTIQTVGPDGQGNRIVSEAYSALSSGYSSFIGRRARGTAASPTAIQNNDVIVRFGGNGYGATKFSQFADARIEFVATENHTDSSKGTQIEFWTTDVGSNVATNIGRMDGNTVTFTGSVEPQKGFIYTPKILEGSQTAISIDYTSDSIIKANLNAALTISHTNHLPGKVVEMWLTNTGGSNRTVTHGISSLNSTNKSTTATIASSSSMYLRFFSIGGDNANTFVSING